MSEFGSVAPPPPLPPPSTGQFDFLRPFTFTFQDPRWVTKVAIGGLFYIAGMLVVGWFFLGGYCARLARNVIAGHPNPLPEWDDLGESFAEGFGLFVVVLAYIAPLAVVVAAIFIPAALLGGWTDQEAIRNASGGLMTFAWCLIFPFSLAVSFFLPAGLMLAVVERRFTAAFELGRLWRYIRGNLANYLLAFVVYLMARFAVPFGLILFCIGVVFTAFWAMITATCAFAQAYRLSPVK